MDGKRVFQASGPRPREKRRTPFVARPLPRPNRGHRQELLCLELPQKLEVRYRRALCISFSVLIVVASLHRDFGKC
jgi:hypothetical protein